MSENEEKDAEVEVEETESAVDENPEADESESREGESTESAPKEPAPEERRKTYRLNKVLGATLTTSEGDSKTTRLFVIDISATGFRATDHQPPGEEDYEISIVLTKGEEPFTSKMRVVWVKELTVSGMYQMGCEFVEPGEEQSEKLRNFIDAEKGRTTTKSTVNIGRPWTMIN